MANIAKGTFKRVAYKKETNWGELAGATGAKEIRRVTSNFNLNAEVYESNEIISHAQVADARNGVRTVEGSINGELSPGTYSDFMAAVVARDWTAGVSIATVTADIAAGANPKLFSLTRSTGSWIADGLRVGAVVRLTGATNADNNNNNLLVIGLTATVAAVTVLSGTSMVAEAAAVLTVTQVGKETFAPTTGHTDDSFTVEEWYSDIGQSESFTGLKVGSVALQLPASGLVTCDIGMQGRNLERTGSTAYFTSPTAPNNNGLFAAVSGAMIVNGAPVALITSADFTIDRGLEGAQVVGSNFNADVFTGRIRVSGNMSTYFVDGVFRDYFNNETEISLVMALSTGSEKDAQVMSFSFPRVKLGSASKQDAEMGITQDHSFTALLQTGGSTIYMQDSTLV